MALFLQIRAGFWRMYVRQRAFGASSLKVLYAQSPHELEPLLFHFIHIFQRVPYFYSHSIENGKTPDFHSDFREMMYLEIQFYLTEEMPSFAGFASQNRNPPFRINLKSISGIEEWGGLISLCKTDNEEGGIMSGAWPWPGKF